MTFALMLTGFAMLAAGTWRQSALVFGRVPPRVRRVALLAGGHAAIASSLVRVLASDDPSRAVVEWVGELTAAGLLVVFGCWLWQRRADRAAPRNAARRAHVQLAAKAGEAMKLDGCGDTGGGSHRPSSI
ncbi:MULTISPECIES: DUF3325 domain-containing protein [unclassified Sphingomonas]|uniref:DUF3325 domain-containing protein n=1 Tax=unclassified Sphingomonas TaxID=196159 RepID=UPI00226988A9|nr:MULTISPECIES: DUF3325 domain-containing protein [unclassified Sphingomonas]